MASSPMNTETNHQREFKESDDTLIIHDLHDDCMENVGERLSSPLNRR